MSHSNLGKLRGGGTGRFEASIFRQRLLQARVSQVVLVVKNPLANAGYIRDTGSTPRLGRSPSGGHGNPLQYSCLENPMDRRA